MRALVAGAAAPIECRISGSGRSVEHPSHRGTFVLVCHLGHALKYSISSRFFRDGDERVDRGFGSRSVRVFVFDWFEREISHELPASAFSLQRFSEHDFWPSGDLWRRDDSG